MEFLANNWAIILILIGIIATVVKNLLDFFEKPSDEQMKSIKEWLLWAVTTAEKELGSDTGKLKLRYAYDLFLTKFPQLFKLISFDKFGELVDEALTEMKQLVSTNKQIEKYVESAE